MPSLFFGVRAIYTIVGAGGEKWVWINSNTKIQVYPCIFTSKNSGITPYSCLASLSTRIWLSMTAEIKRFCKVKT